LPLASNIANKRFMTPPILKAVLGPTNTGKTHYAVERMLGRDSGVIGLPLRLLAREVYDKICAIKTPAQCALVTGEEKIIPKTAHYFVCTAEAMPTDRRFSFAAIDEVQLMANPERGHIFTDRVLNYRGSQETLLMGSDTARPVLETLLPDIRFDYRERFSTLSYSGPMRLTRLPKRSVIVAFSAKDVYTIAELVRRYRGGAAVVMGALSPRTRNAQAELFQSGDVDFLIATDAIGMGLNLNTDHVAFAAMSKFDGRRRRYLHPMEAGQIAGRAGRFRNHGTFGTTGDCPEMDDNLVSRIENHKYDAFQYAEWRNAALDFSSFDSLMESLHMPRPIRRLRRVKGTVDEQALERMSAITEIRVQLTTPLAVRRLWEICQIPDFRNLTIDAHVRLLQDIYGHISEQGFLPDDYLDKHILRLDQTEGDVHLLSSRLAQIRTWTYCANKLNWSFDSKHWIKRTRMVEDRLSDALHERLTARFVDRRTSALLKGIGAGAYMEASLKDNGDVMVDDHIIGHLDGLTFKIAASGTDLEAKALQAAAEKVVGPEVNRKLTSLCGGSHAIFTLSERGKIMWGGQAVGRIARGGSILNPDAELIGGDLGNANLRQLAQDRMRDFLRGEVAAKLSCLSKLKVLSEAPETPPEARGLAYQMFQNNGSLERRPHLAEIKAADQDARRALRQAGMVFGFYNLYLKDLMKPKPANLLSLLTAYGAGGDGMPFIPFAGVTSLANEGQFDSENFSDLALSSAGYKACGPRIIRFDILNRLSGLIRQAQLQSKTRKFQIMQEMLALLGCTYEDAQGVLRSLGFQSELVKREEVEAMIAKTAAEEKVRAEKKAEKEKAEAQKKAANQPAVSETLEDTPPDATPETPENTTPDTTTDTVMNAALETPLNEKTPDGTVPEITAPKTTASEGVTSGGTPSEPRRRQRVSKPAPKPLHVYNHRKVDEETGETLEIVNNEFWVIPFKKRSRGNFSKGKGKPLHGAQKFRQNNRKAKASGKPKDPQKSQNYKAKEERRMADSPFAALAALKTPKKD